jgi:hypothetical protein
VYNLRHGPIWLSNLKNHSRLLLIDIYFYQDYYFYASIAKQFLRRYYQCSTLKITINKCLATATRWSFFCSSSRLRITPSHCIVHLYLKRILFLIFLAFLLNLCVASPANKFRKGNDAELYSSVRKSYEIFKSRSPHQSEPVHHVSRIAFKQLWSGRCVIIPLVVQRVQQLLLILLL